MVPSNLIENILKKIKDKEVKLKEIYDKQTAEKEECDDVEKAVLTAYRLTAEAITLIDVLLDIEDYAGMVNFRQTLEDNIKAQEKEIVERLF